MSFPAPLVRVSGSQFVKQDGSPTRLYGVDIQATASSSNYQKVTSLGNNFVRLAVHWEDIETSAPTGTGTDYSTYTHMWQVGGFTATGVLANVDAMVQFFQTKGVYVLMDFHQAGWSTFFGGFGGIPPWYYSDSRFPGFANKSSQGTAIWNFWSGDASVTSTHGDNRVLYKAFAQFMVNRYSQYSNVIGYEIFNEPNPGAPGGGLSFSAITNTMLTWQASIKDYINSIDPSRAIFISTRGGGSGVQSADYTILGLSTTTKANPQNIVLDCHAYYTGLAPGNISGSGTSGQVGLANGDDWYPTSTAEYSVKENEANHNNLKKFPTSSYAGTDPYEGPYVGTFANQESLHLIYLNRSASFGIPLIMGEWGVLADDSNRLTYQRHMFQLFDKYQMSFARWNLGSAGTGNSGLGILDSSGNFLDVVTDNTIVNGFPGGLQPYFAMLNAAAPGGTIATDPVASTPMFYDPTWTNANQTEKERGRVNSILENNGVVYVGGNFTHVIDSDGTTDLSTLPFLAAYNKSTGRLIQTWAPAPSGPLDEVGGRATGRIYDMALSNDGTTLYVAGTFTSICGVSRTYVAALNALSGPSDTSAATASNNLNISFTGGSGAYAVVLDETNARMFVGGDFTTVAGASQNGVVKLTNTGTGGAGPFLTDTFTRTLSGSVGTADSGQSATILQGNTTDYAVNGSALQITMPAGQAPILEYAVDTTHVDFLYSYSFSSAPTGAQQIMGPIWWVKDALNYYRMSITQTLGGNTNLLVQQQVNNVNTAVPMDWGSGPVTSTKQITAQVAGQKYWCRIRVENDSGVNTFKVKVWQDGTTEPSTFLGTGSDITGAAQTHGGIGWRGQCTSGSTNTPTYTIDNVSATDLDASGGGWTAPGSTFTTAVTLAGGKIKDMTLKPDTKDKLVLVGTMGTNEIVMVNPSTGANLLWTYGAATTTGRFMCKSDTNCVYVSGGPDNGDTMICFDWTGGGPNDFTAAIGAHANWFYSCNGNVQALELGTINGTAVVLCGHHGTGCATVKNTAGVSNTLGGHNGLYVVTSGTSGGTLFTQFGGPPNYYAPNTSGGAATGTPLKLWAINYNAATGTVHTGGDFTAVNVNSSASANTKRRYARFDTSGSTGGGGGGGGGTTTGASTTIVLATGDLLGGSASTATATKIKSYYDAGTASALLVMGDNAYPDGSDSNFTGTFDPTWGSMVLKNAKAFVRPTTGSHDWGGWGDTASSPTSFPGVTGYKDYYHTTKGITIWDSAHPPNASEPVSSYFYTEPIVAPDGSATNWVLITVCGVKAVTSNKDSDGLLVALASGSVQNTWLQGVLQSAKAAGKYAIINAAHCYYSCTDDHHAPEPLLKPLWDLIQSTGMNGRCVVVGGHHHNYQRFKPQDNLGNAKTDSTGSRQFICGVAGISSTGYVAQNTPANWDVLPGTSTPAYSASVHGFLEFTLTSTGYSFRFINSANGSVFDSGTVTLASTGGVAPSGGLPTLSDPNPTVGELLTANPGSWSGTAPISFSYQWQTSTDGITFTNSTDVGNATSGVTLGAGDLNNYMQCVVTATNLYGSTSANTPVTGQVAAAPSNPVNTAPPVVTPQSPIAGQVLTSTSGSWSNSPTSFSYTWQRMDPNSNAITTISGATSSTYPTQTTDAGFQIRSQVVASNVNGPSPPIPSNWTNVVQTQGGGSGGQSSGLWIQAGMYGGGFGQVVQVDPFNVENVSFSGDTGGQYISTNKGFSFISRNKGVTITSDMNVASNFYHPHKQGFQYRLTKNGLWESKDGVSTATAITQSSPVQPTQNPTSVGSSVHPRATGHLMCIDNTGSLVIGCDQGILYRAGNVGTTYTSKNGTGYSGLQAVALCNDPLNPNIVYVSDGTGVYRCNDITQATPAWTAITGATNVQDMLVFNGVLFAVTNTNKTVIKLLNPSTVTSGWVTLYTALVNTGVLDVTSRVESGVVATYVAVGCSLGASGAAAGSVPVLLGRSTTGFASDNGIWSTKGAPFGTGNVNDYNGPNTPTKPWWLVAGHNNVSLDGTSSDVDGLAFEPGNPDVLYWAGRGGGWKCSNLTSANAVFYPMIDGLAGGYHYGHAWDPRSQHPGTLYIAVSDWGGGYSKDGGVTFTNIIQSTHGKGVSVDATSGATVWCFTNAANTPNTGSVWTQSDIYGPSVTMTTLSFPAIGVGGIVPAMLDCCTFRDGSGNPVVIAASVSGVRKLTGMTVSGSTWSGGVWSTPTGLPSTLTTNKACFAVKDDGSGHVAFFERGTGVWVSTDFGSTWTQAYTFTTTSDYIGYVALDPRPGNYTLYITTTNTILSSTNAFTSPTSATWTDITGPVQSPGAIATGTDGSIGVVQRNSATTFPKYWRSNVNSPGTWTADTDPDGTFANTALFPLWTSIQPTGEATVGTFGSGTVVSTPNALPAPPPAPTPTPISPGGSTGPTTGIIPDPFDAETQLSYYEGTFDASGTDVTTILANNHRDLRNFTNAARVLPRLQTDLDSLPQTSLDNVSQAQLEDIIIGTGEAWAFLAFNGINGVQNIQVGPITDFNNWNGIQAPLTGTDTPVLTAVSSMPTQPVDISEFDYVSCVVPGGTGHWNSVDLSASFIKLDSSPAGDFSNSAFVSAAANFTTGTSSELRVTTANLLSGAGVSFQPTQITGIMLSFTGTGAVGSTGTDGFTRTIADTANGTWGTGDDSDTWTNDATTTTGVTIGVNGTQGHATWTGGKNFITAHNTASNPDWDITVTVQWDKAATGAILQQGPIARYQANAGSPNFYQAFLRQNTDGSIDLRNVYHHGATTTNISPNTLVVGSAGSWVAGQQWNIRLRVAGSNIYSKAWLTGTTEPTDWQQQDIDANVTGAGLPGMEISTNAGISGTTNWLVDNFTWSALNTSLPTPGNTLNILGLRAYKTGFQPYTLGVNTIDQAVETPVTFTGSTSTHIFPNLVRGQNAQTDPQPTDAVTRMFIDLGSLAIASGSTYNTCNLIQRENAVNQSYNLFQLSFNQSSANVSLQFVQNGVSNVFGIPVTTVPSTVWAQLRGDGYLVFEAELTGQQATITLYESDANQVIGNRLFQVGQTLQSPFSTTQGRVGWSGNLVDRDAQFLAFDGAGLSFATFTTKTMQYRTPVEGVQLTATYSEDTNLFTSFTGPVSLDSNTTLSGNPTWQSSGPIVSNTFIISNYTQSFVEFDIWIPATNGSILPYLAFRSPQVATVPVVPLSVQPLQWNHVQIELGEVDGLQPSIPYQLYVEMVAGGSGPYLFNIDNMKIVRRNVVWMARSTTDGPWYEFRDMVNEALGAVHFPRGQRGKSLQIRADAISSDAWIGPWQAKVTLAKLGRLLSDQA